MRHFNARVRIPTRTALSSASSASQDSVQPSAVVQDPAG